MPRKADKYTVVAFYHKNAEFGWMANTYQGYPVKIKDESSGEIITWPTTEHYFQAMKFPGNTPQEKEYRRQILEYNDPLSQFPAKAKAIAGKIFSADLKQHWQQWDGTSGQMNGRKHQVMRTAIRAKIEQHPQLKAELLTLPPDCIIAEATANDKNWGDGNNGTGTNHLGIIWMEELRRLHNLRENNQLLPNAAATDYEAFNKTRTGKSLYDFPLMTKTAKANTQASVYKLPESKKKYLNKNLTAFLNSTGKTLSETQKKQVLAVFQEWINADNPPQFMLTPKYGMARGETSFPLFFSDKNASNVDSDSAKGIINTQFRARFLHCIQDSFNGDTLVPERLQAHLNKFPAEDYHSLYALADTCDLNLASTASCLAKLINQETSHTSVGAWIDNQCIAAITALYSKELEKKNACISAPPFALTVGKASIEEIKWRLEYYQDKSLLLIPFNTGAHFVLLIKRKDQPLEYWDPTHGVMPAKLKNAFPEINYNRQISTEAIDCWSCGHRVARQAMKLAGIDCALTRAPENDPQAIWKACADTLKAFKDAPDNFTLIETKPELPTPSNSSSPMGLRKKATPIPAPPAETKTQDLRNYCQQNLLPGRKVTTEASGEKRIHANSTNRNADVIVTTREATCKQPEDDSIAIFAALAEKAGGDIIVTSGSAQDIKKLADACAAKKINIYIQDKQGKEVKYADYNKQLQQAGNRNSFFDSNDKTESEKEGNPQQQFTSADNVPKK